MEQSGQRSRFSGRFDPKRVTDKRTGTRPLFQCPHCEHLVFYGIQPCPGHLFASPWHYHCVARYIVETDDAFCPQCHEHRLGDDQQRATPRISRMFIANFGQYMITRPDFAKQAGIQTGMVVVYMAILALFMWLLPNRPSIVLGVAMVAYFVSQYKYFSTAHQDYVNLRRGCRYVTFQDLAPGEDGVMSPAPGTESDFFVNRTEMGQNINEQDMDLVDVLDQGDVSVELTQQERDALHRFRDDYRTALRGYRMPLANVWQAVGE